ncbi:hypothetical protein ABEO87_15775, partial [Geobacillus stearothermophilus]|uniref:hypothetical protein n=1 Tax=Geobacillus stearothermophilus TaxID=1422 RepID=UPI003D1AECB5
TKSEGRPPIGETRWRACEEAVAAAAGPKRREPMAAGAGHQSLFKANRASVSFSFEGMRNSFSCFAPASSSRFKEDGFLGAKLQGSRLKAVASFGFEGMRNSFKSACACVC